MHTGRNSPCPCGSGKKYKHCCLNAMDSGSVPAGATTDLAWQRLRTQLDGYVVNMLDFATSTYGPSAVLEAWEEFFGEDDVKFDPQSLIMQLFMPWFFNFWSPDPAGTMVRKKSLHDVIPVAAYLSARGRQMDPLLRRYLESLLSTPLTFLEVLTCEPGAGMTMRDVMTGQEHAVTERGASQGMQPGDMLFGQLASVDHLWLLEASNGFAIPPVEKAPIIELRARIASGHPVITNEILREHDYELIDLYHEIADRLLNPRLPTLQNTDGDPLSQHKLIFDLNATPQAAFDALKHLAVDEPDEELLDEASRDSEGRLKRVQFVWKKLGNKLNAGWDNTLLGRIEIDGERLTAEVNSKARAATIRKEIQKALGMRVRYRASEIQSPEEMLAELRAEGGKKDNAAARESDSIAEIPEVRARISEMMAAHWEQWVDGPLSILGDRTPMEAAKDADGREIVESLIIQAERHARGNPAMATDEAVYRRLRERLGLSGGRGNPAQGSPRSGRDGPA